MTLLSTHPDLPAPPAVRAANAVHAADDLAIRNGAANLRALAATQPDVVALTRTAPAGVQWVFGRDGSLTAFDGAPGRWWAGCSVPRAASAAMLRTLDVRGAVACFLAPAHAAALRVALDALKPEQAIVAVVPDARTLAVMLRAEHFGGDVAAHRLWFAAGPGWEAMLDRLLTDRTGLPTPSQFIRLMDGTEEQADALIGPAQRIFADHGTRRAAAITRLRDEHRDPRRPVRRACVVAPSRFRLWDDAGDVLAGVARELDWPRFDPDDPASASPLALAEAVAACDAIVTANTARADLPNVAARQMPWVTWLTAPRIPTFDAATGPHDALLVADPAWRELARAAGWPADRVHVAGWPAADVIAAPGDELVILADTSALEPPRQVVDFSSHRLLWELVRDELLRDPFAVSVGVIPYLAGRARRVGVADDALDRRAFIDDLIAPAYARGLATVLAAAGLPVVAHGAGWGDVPELARVSRAPIATRDALHDAVRRAAGIVHVWPGAEAHASTRYGRPLLRAGAGRAAFVRAARRILSGAGDRAQASPPSLTAARLASVFGLDARAGHEPAD